MCTLTVLRAGNMLRVACNRDERRDRPVAHPPFITRAGALQVLTPQDPRGRGTWIAANSAGLVFALLNANPARMGAIAERSRGLVIPSIVESATLEDVAHRIHDVRPCEFAPFRLLATDAFEVAEFVACDGEWRARSHDTSTPLLFTSSSLGDAIVEGPRRALFDQTFGICSDIAAQQDAFHSHRWRDRPAVSVHMSRPDAATVSTTTVEVTSRQVRMLYQPAHFPAGTPVGLIIDRQDVQSASALGPRREYAAV
jgi:hypothetical protein